MSTPGYFSVASTPCQLEIVIPLSCINERPEPVAFPLGKEPKPLMSPIQLLSLSTTPLLLSSDMILLPVGLSSSSNSFSPEKIITLYNLLQHYLSSSSFHSTAKF